MAITYRHFNPIQDPKMIGVDAELMAMLDLAREKAGVPFIITSGLRTKAENDALPNSVMNSAHLVGLAVDLVCTTTSARFHILNGAYSVGFRRIGMGKTYIHLDISKTLPDEIFFLEDGLIC